MNVRGAAVQSGLAALGLVVAYGTWQREPERAPGEVVVVDASKNEVTKVRYTDDKGKTVELVRRNESGEEPRIWLRLSADATKKTPEREVPGNEGAQRLWDKFAPLHATRGLGVLPDAKLKELGLDAPKKKLEVTARGGTTTFDIGASPFGVSDPYVRDQHDKRVYVLGGGGVLSDLDSAGVRLVDRTLHSFKPGDYDGLTVAAGGKSRELSVPASENAFAAKLVGKSGKPDEQAKNWHDKVWRTMVTEVLGKGENPKAGTPEMVCKLSYGWKGKSKGFLELGRLPAPPPEKATSSQPPATDVWGKSEHTASWVKLPATTEPLLTECAKIAASE